MKNKYCRNIINTALLTFALPTGVALAGPTEVVTTTPAPADGCLDWLKISGYAAATYATFEGTNSFWEANTPFDVVKVGFEGTYGPFTGYASLFYTPNVEPDEAGFLDAYVTYKAGNFSITGGKYLSYLGYEAFDTVNMNQITYATGIGAIPAYHSGLRVDYADDIWGAGFSVSDSEMGGTGFWVGDEDFSDDLGVEGYVSYKGISKLIVWAGFGYENTEDASQDWATYDLWASYDVSDKFTVAGEIAYHQDQWVEGYQGLLFGKYAFTDKFSLVGRWGFALPKDGGADTYSYTISPTYAFCKNILLRGELTYYDSEYDEADGLFGGVQAILKF